MGNELVKQGKKDLARSHTAGSRSHFFSTVNKLSQIEGKDKQQLKELADKEHILLTD